MINRNDLCIIDLGHGVGQDRGADGRTFDGCLEETIIDTLGKNILVHLKNLGQNYLESRPLSATTESDSLNKRVAFENSLDCKLFISIHANTTRPGTGTEIYTYNGDKLIEAQFILTKMNQLGFPNRGIKDGSNLAVIRGTKAKAMLIETCFCDNPNDVKLFNENMDSIARIIVSAITGIDCTIVSPTPPQKGLFRVQVGAFSDRGGAEKIMNELKLKGYQAYIKED